MEVPANDSIRTLLGAVAFAPSNYVTQLMTAAAPLAFVFVSISAPRLVLVTVSTRLLSNLRPLTPLTTPCVCLTRLVGSTGRGTSPRVGREPVRDRVCE